MSRMYAYVAPRLIRSLGLGCILALEPPRYEQLPRSKRCSLCIGVSQPKTPVYTSHPQRREWYKSRAWIPLPLSRALGYGGESTLAEHGPLHTSHYPSWHSTEQALQQPSSKGHAHTNSSFKTQALQRYASDSIRPFKPRNVSAAAACSLDLHTQPRPELNPP